jgi:uncharacterized protein (DUF433 family)
MPLESYFDFLSPDDIRVRGHRIGIDDILGLYLEGYSADEIATQFPTLSLEQIYVTITYYLQHRAELDAYLARLAARREQRYEAWAANPPPAVQHLRGLQTQRRAERIAA